MQRPSFEELKRLAGYRVISVPMYRALGREQVGIARQFVLRRPICYDDMGELAMYRPLIEAKFPDGEETTLDGDLQEDHPVHGDMLWDYIRGRCTCGGRLVWRDGLSIGRDSGIGRVCMRCRRQTVFLTNNDV